MIQFTTLGPASDRFKVEAKINSEKGVVHITKDNGYHSQPQRMKEQNLRRRFELWTYMIDKSTKYFIGNMLYNMELHPNICKSVFQYEVLIPICKLLSIFFKTAVKNGKVSEVSLFLNLICREAKG